MIQKSCESSTASYHGIDLIKFLCAFLVVSIHVAPFSEGHFQNAQLLNFLYAKVFARIAVPFYFTASGFFLFRGMDRRSIDMERIGKYCWKLLRMYALWSLLLFTGKDMHLWYLKATVVAVIFVGLCFRWCRRDLLIGLLALGLYGLGISGDAYYWYRGPFHGLPLTDFLTGMYVHFFDTTRNGFFMGVPFVLMGALLSRKPLKLRAGLAALGFVCSLAALFLEAHFLESRGICEDYNMYLMLLPTNFFLFVLALNLNLKDRPGYQKLREIGALIYYLHMLVFTVLEFLFRPGVESSTGELFPFAYPLTAVVTFLAAVGIHWLSRREKLGWLQYLYR